MEREKLKILYLAYFFAPQNTVAAFRALKFTKYMPENEIIPYVFTSENCIHFNSNLINDIPSEAVIIRKSSKLDSNSIFSLKLNSKLTLKTMIKTFLRDVFFSPDKYIWWFITSLPQLIKLIKKEKIDVILATGSPFSSNICAFFLKKLCHIPMVLDFRDPWKENVVLKKQSSIRQFFNSYWEKKCVMYADGIISVTNEIVSYLKQYKTEAKFMEITNGFDLDDYSEIENKKELDCFLFLYTGKFSINIENYNPETVIEAFIKFSKNKKGLVKLIFIGITDDETTNFIDSLETKCIKYFPPMNKDMILKWQAKADILVQFYHPINHTNAISMKVFEYIAQKKPVISFNVKQGKLFELLEKYDLGETASSHDVLEMTALFGKAYDNKIKFINNKLDSLEEYEFRYLTKKLANFLDNSTK